MTRVALYARYSSDNLRRSKTNYASAGRRLSASAIARALNAEGIVGPDGNLWNDSTIRGHVKRGTGLINNELYIDRLVWNRQRYVKDPSTGRRVSRINAESEWIGGENASERNRRQVCQCHRGYTGGAIEPLERLAPVEGGVRSWRRSTAP
jgi:hypothetical protein